MRPVTPFMMIPIFRIRYGLTYSFVVLRQQEKVGFESRLHEKHVSTG
jgi:hypothetical protein